LRLYLFHKASALDNKMNHQTPRKLQLLKTGSTQLGIFADEIATVAPWRAPTPLPQAPKSVLGVVSIEGRMLTVLDLSLLRGEQVSSNYDASDTHKRLIALRGDEQLALAVDSVGETIELDSGDLDPNQGADKLVLGILRHDGADINILNLKELFSTAIQGRERRRRRF
jgi:purine-binding chemotaxis protein CheW